MPIPAILNRRAGAARSAGALREALAADARFALEEVAPDHLLDATTRALCAGAPRVAVAGGDGTMAAAATALLDHPAAELAVLPGGTLNHFARHLGVPTEPAAALELAAGGAARLVDVGWAGDRLFLNTSSVGAYATFVRLRERLERYLPYASATLVGGLLLFFRLPHARVELAAEGRARVYDTPLVFIGVGEREAEASTFADWPVEGQRGLHVIVVRGRRRARLLALGFAAVRGGPRAAARQPGVDSAIVERFRVSVERPRVRVATDGELWQLDTPIEYRIERERLRVVAPPPA